MKIYNVNGNQEQTADISKFVIYGHGVKLYEIESEAFKACEMRRNSYGHEEVKEIYGGDIRQITLAQPIKRAIKENLTRKDNYTLNYTPDYCKWETRKALYIHESEIAVEDMGALLAMETDEERNYLHAVRLRFANPVVFRRLHAEKIPCADDWTLPEGAKWGSHYGTEESPCFDTYDNSKSNFPEIMKKKRPNWDPNEKGVVKRWATAETVENAAIICCERYYVKTEYSPDRIRKNALAEALNASGLFRDSFSHYDIDKLEKVFNITLKEGA